MRQPTREGKHAMGKAAKDDFKKLEQTILKAVIQHREDVLETSVKEHAGRLLKTKGYGRLMADYNREKRKIAFLRNRLEEY